jgi:hypothetical protein
MAKYVLLLVVAFQATACLPSIPRDLYIDDKFDEFEEAAIVEMIGELNHQGQELLGKDLVRYRGRHVDNDGWNLNNADDDFNVIYKATEPDDNYRYLEEQEGTEGIILGLGLQGDIILYAFNMLYSSPDGSWCIPAIITEVPADEDSGSTDNAPPALRILPTDRWRIIEPPADSTVEAITSDDCDNEVYTLYPPLLKTVILHEMGHFVGLGHIKDPNALMYPYSNGMTTFSDNDKRALCCIYECVTDAYACDWSLVEPALEEPGIQ